jgi:hypothetical protein
MLTLRRDSVFTFHIRSNEGYPPLLGREVGKATSELAHLNWLEHTNALLDFIGDYMKTFEVRDCERGSDGNISGVSPHCHQHAANTRLIVTGIERPPAIAEICFKLGTEIHRIGRCRNSDVAEISGRVSRWNIQGSTEGNCQMLIIAADAQALGIDIQSCLCGTGM